MLALAYQLRRNSKFPYFPGVVGGETKIKAKLSPAKAGAWAELGKIMKLIMHNFDCSQAFDTAMLHIY